MSQSSTKNHHILSDTALPYISNSSVTSANPQWIAGQNILSNLKGISELRPGFGAAVESVATGFTALKRIFAWSKWSVGTAAPQFYAMFCDVAGGVAKVYKYAYGADASAVLIFTSASAVPFDFIVSNNTCYLGNGTEMRKFLAATTADTNTYKCGITRPASPTVAVGSGTSTKAPTAAAGSNWTNPTYAEVDDANYAVYNNTAQDYLKLTTFGLTVGSSNVPVGIVVKVKGNGTAAGAADRQIKVGLTKDGTTLVGTEKLVTLNQTTDTTITCGYATDLWTTTFTYAEVEAATFGVLIRDADTTAAALNINYVTVTVYFGPTGSLSAAVGYNYCTTYGNSTTGHESSPSDVSSCTGVFTTSEVSVTLVASADTQVDKIHVYRTTDGGSADPSLMQEITNSPFANANATITDTTADASLAVNTAPADHRNDPPPVGRGFINAQSRIEYFTNASVWITGAEEISVGVPEECVPGGDLGINGGGNVFNFSNQVTGLAAMDDGFAVALPLRFMKVEGDSIDTLRRYKLMDRRGVRNLTCIASLGSTIAWIDTANQVWVSDLGEIGLAIRPDLAALDHTQAAIAVHISGNFHWIVVMDGANGKLFIYDLDTNRWMVPWKVGTTCSALFSGETSLGNVDLLLARNQTKALKLTASTFADDGNTYSATGTTGLLWIAEVNDVLERYDKANPAYRGLVDFVELKTNQVTCDKVEQVNDDDPSQASFTDISANVQDAPDVPVKTYIKNKQYRSQPDTDVTRMAAFRFTWNASGNKFVLYTIVIEHHPFGT